MKPSKLKIQGLPNPAKYPDPELWKATLNTLNKGLGADRYEAALTNVNDLRNLLEAKSDYKQDNYGKEILEGTLFGVDLARFKAEQSERRKAVELLDRLYTVLEALYPLLHSSSVIYLTGYNETETQV